MAIPIVFTEPATVNTGGLWSGNDAVWASGFGLFLLCGHQAIANVASMQTTPDGVTFTMQTMPAAITWESVAYAPTLGSNGRAVAVGTAQAAWSDDGVTWTAATSLPEANQWRSVRWWAAQSLFIACAANGTHRIMTSTDGKSWTNQTAAAAKTWNGLAVSDTVAVCLASGGPSTQQVQTSPDGVTWTLQTHASLSTNRGIVSTDRNSVGYSDTLDMFLFTGTDGGSVTKAYRSTDDGVTWTASGVIPTILNTTVRGYLWLGNGINSWYMMCRTFFYGESLDGDTWTVTAMPTTFSKWTPLGWDGTSKIFGGSDGSGDVALFGEIDVSTLLSLTPNFGTKRGGTVVTLTGTGFTGATSVTFGGTAALSVTVLDDTTLSCVTPPHAIGLVDVEVIGVGSLTNAYSFVSVDHVSPKSGTVAGSTPVTITGFGFAAASSVLFDGVAATDVVVISNLKLTAVTPAHTAGRIDVEVVGVETGEELYTYTLPIPQNLGKGPLLPPIPTRRQP